MKKLFFVLSIGIFTTSCIPVQLVDQQYNEYHHVEVVVVEQPILISPPPVHPRPPIYKPIEKPRKDTIRPVRTTPDKRPTTPVQPVRKPPTEKAGSAEKTNTIQRKRKE